MARIQVMAQFACALLLLAIPANAQRPPHGPSGPGGSSLFDALREVFQETPNREVFELVNQDSVRREISLSEENAKQLFDTLHEARRKVYSLGRDLDPKLSKEEIKAKLRDTIKPFEDASFEILEKNSDFDRLLGIYAHLRNNRAILIDPVAKKIGIQGAALDELRRTRTVEGRRLWLETREAIDRVMRNAPPEANSRSDIARLVEQSEHKLDHKLGERLTDEQRAKLEELKVKTELTTRIFDRPPRRPGERNGPPGEKRHEPDPRHHKGNSSDSKCEDRGEEQLVGR